ncbi:DUF721 domain-containing protein [Schaalia sp. lx-100]|uniref:DUF721 domain-containing protein n=1 Tax=Schaalia sp. lx-100 TaxID=2899081 RepID=UPI001E302029|nr:DciA family protein [Schaalia sp. lx-100]MCD4557831.1 DciA family protein [Schaalia sp. lx-100]
MSSAKSRYMHTQQWEESALFARHAFRRAQELAEEQGHIRAHLPRRHRFALRLGMSEEYAIESDDISAADVLHHDADNVGDSVHDELNRAAYHADTEGDLVSLGRRYRSGRSVWKRQPGMAATRVLYRSPRSMKTVVDRLIADSGWQTQTKMGTIMAKWPQIVGKTVAEHCNVETFEDKKLIVRCTSTAWTKQLQLLLPTIERRIAEEIGAGVVKQVVVRGPAAPSWKKGLWSVPGRGPRDTYN